MDKHDPWLSWAVELQSLAQAGLYYGKDRFDLERYQRIRDIAAEMIAHQSGLSLDKVKDLIDRPLIIGEYHFGTVDRGYAQSLWQVESQEQRGVAYRYYTEHAYAHPSLIGTGYFQWADQDISGRFDGENYNCGLVDVTDRPYREQVEAMAETAKVLYDIHSGTALPYSRMPRNCRGHGAIPDLWNASLPDSLSLEGSVYNM